MDILVKKMNNIILRLKKVIVILCRRKFYNKKKYNEFLQLLNTLQIPKKFDYQNCIPKVFNDENYHVINKFEYNEYLLFYNCIKKNINCKTMNYNKDVVIIVHPFYPMLRHTNFLIMNWEYFKKYRKYEKEIFKLIKKSDCNIIICDSPDNYARFGYYLLKYDNVKEIVFTEHSTGRMLENTLLKKIDNYSKVYLAGCYKNHCIEDIKHLILGKEIIEIKSCILERAEF